MIFLAYIESDVQNLRLINGRFLTISKGGFFSESAMCFLDLQISKKIFQKTILSSKFKFQVQDSFLEYIFFGDLEI